MPVLIIVLLISALVSVCVWLYYQKNLSSLYSLSFASVNLLCYDEKNDNSADGLIAVKG